MNETKNKMVTFWLHSATILMLDRIHGQSIAAGKKMTKSALLDKAIKLLEKDLSQDA